MKKDKTLIITVVMLMATLSALPSLALNNNSVSHVISYSGAPVIGTDSLGGVIYSTVSYGGFYNGGEPGMPSLPIDYIRFSVPYNATNFTVTATVNRWSNQYLDHLLYPCQRPLYGDGSDSLTITLPDSSAYYSGEYYPSQLAWVADEGYLAGENHIVTVAVMPLRYSHTSTSDILSRAFRCNLTLRFDLSDDLSMSPIVRKDSLLREKGYVLAQSMVVNPEQVKNFAPSSSFASGIDPIGGIIQGGIGGNILNGGGDTPIQDTTEINDLIINYPYLIVTTSELKHSIRRIAALKRQKGYNVKVVTMDEVLSSIFSGHGDVVGEGRYAQLTNTSNDGKLRQFLRNYYKIFGTEYVLLAGDIPYQQFSFKPTDLYYSDLSASWLDMSNEDHMPELFIGRITSENEEEVDNYTDKLFRYELNPGHGNTSYLRKAFFSEGREFTNYLNKFKSSLSSIYPNPVIINDYNNNNSQYPNGTNVIDTLRSNPVGFISIYNHGDSIRTRVYGPDDQDHNYFIYSIKTTSSGNGLNYLRNKWYPMIYYSPSCATIPFDYPYHLTFGESFINGKDYGGPVYIGYTRTVASHEGARLTDAFANRIKDGFYKLSIAFSMSKADTWSETYVANFIQVFLGDPELDLWTDNPQCYSNIVIERTNHGVTISGINADSTIVAYLNKDNRYMTRIATSTSSSDSIILPDASPNSTIMLYKHNYIPYIAPLKLQNGLIKDSQYIIASDMIAGHSIDSKRPNGDVIVENGVEYEVEASGTVTLEDGFKVEKGATFAVYPSSF